MRKIFLVVLLILFSVILPLRAQSLDNIAEEIELYIGEMRAIQVHSPTRIVIGNPSVIDVNVVNKNEITIIPKSAGATTFVYWDKFGEQSFKIKIFAENMKDIKFRVDNLLNKLNLSEVYTKAEEEEGKVLLLGRVKTSQERERIITILGTLKDKIVDLVQVKEEESVIDIDVQVMELTKDATNTLGLSWPEKITLTEVGSPGILEAGTKWSTLFKILNLNRAAFAFTLDALVQEGKAQILSRPRLACQSGKEAELTVGGEKPVFTTQVSGSSGGQGTSVEYKNYGIKLKVKPTLTDEKRIKLSVNVEVSDVGAPETIGTTGGSSGNTTTAKAYPLVKRSASTELYLDNGQTMVIGGLMKKKTEEDIRKVPGLGNLPIIGLVFRKKITKEGGGQGERGDVELFITLTPTVTSEEKKAPKQPDKDISQDNRTAVKEESLDPIASYAKIIKERILVNLTYPNDLKDARYQGTVKLSLRISYTGELLEVTVIESSGYRLLDEQAILMVKNAGSFPPFPTSIEQNELWIEAPIMYQLN